MRSVTPCARATDRQQRVDARAHPWAFVLLAVAALAAGWSSSVTDSCAVSEPWLAEERGVPVEKIAFARHAWNTAIEIIDAGKIAGRRTDRTS